MNDYSLSINTIKFTTHFYLFIYSYFYLFFFLCYFSGTVTKTKKKPRLWQSLFLCNRNFLLCLICNNDKIFYDKKLYKLDESIIKRTHHKTKPKQKKIKKTQNPFSFSLFSFLFCCLLMLVLLSSLSSFFVPENGCFHMSHHAIKIQKVDLQLIPLMEV